MPKRETIPRIRGTQVGLRNPDLVATLKAEMLQGTFAYSEVRGQIGGVRDQHGTYHIGEGHHRMVAALEIYTEIGDAAAVLTLISCGRWSQIDRPPSGSRPLPSRKWWGALRNRLGI